MLLHANRAIAAAELSVNIFDHYRVKVVVNVAIFCLGLFVCGVNFVHEIVQANNNCANLLAKQPQFVDGGEVLHVACLSHVLAVFTQGKGVKDLPDNLVGVHLGHQKR